MSQIVPIPLTADAYTAIQEEIHRTADAARARMDDRTRIICRSRNGFMGRNLAYMRTPYKRGLLERLAGAIEDAWAMLWAMVHCLPEMGEHLGLWERIDHDSCEGCKHYLGGGCCRLNLEDECAAGGYEMWEE